MYNKCLERNLIKEVGCQPEWINSVKPTNETSCTREQIRSYLWRMLQITYMGQKTIFLKFGCKRPCEYFEYKVNCLLFFKLGLQRNCHWVVSQLLLTLNL